LSCISWGSLVILEVERRGWRPRVLGSAAGSAGCAGEVGTPSPCDSLRFGAIGCDSVLSYVERLNELIGLIGLNGEAQVLHISMVT
jgi:hypothetical protein